MLRYNILLVIPIDAILLEKLISNYWSLLCVC